MNVLFLQTADSIYWPLLEQTSRTVRAYCTHHGFSFETFFGIIRGYYPWQATLNRIAMLQGLVDAGFVGWVCYLDADAYIVDIDFDLRAYLHDKADKALVIAAAAPDAPWWHVNSGVFMVNLESPVGRRIARLWYARFMAISDAELQQFEERSPERGDQWLLAQTLLDMPEAEAHVFIDRGTPHVINYNDGAFIRHQLRAYGSLKQRHDRIRDEVDALLRSMPTSEERVEFAGVAGLQEELARALYRVVLLREPDPEGFATWLEFIRSGATLEDVMRAYFRSDEFARRHRDFIDAYVDPAPVGDDEV
ncbi:MAG TPA: DUF4214 domain-containing protein [Acidisphaera sp.]|nr:DUF4214 domain-containing protein [Acidisphaera sp.]